MKITEDLIASYIYNSNDNYHKILMMRLYDEYQNSNLINEMDPEEVSLLQVKGSTNNIINALYNPTKDKPSYLNDKENLKPMIKDIERLEIYFSNFKFQDKAKLKQCMNLITRLECFLKLPITFSFNLEDCIKEELTAIMNDSFSKKMER